MRSNLKLFGLISLVLVLIFLSGCKIEPDPIKYNVSIQAPTQASLNVTGNSIGTKTVSADEQRSFLVTAGETLHIRINYTSSEKDYSVYQWNGAIKADELNASSTITNNTSISVIFKEKFTISFTAPTNSNITIFKNSSILKTIDAGNTDSITDWIGTEVSFSLVSPPDNHELNISSGGAEKTGRLSGFLEISSDDNVLLSTSLMPSVTLISPTNYSLIYKNGDQENSVLLQGETISIYVVSGSTLTVSVKDLDNQNFEITSWGGLSPNSTSTGEATINANTTIEVGVSQIPRILTISEPSPNAYVNVYEMSDLSGAILPGVFQDGLTTYSIGSGETVYLSPQDVPGSSFISWGSIISDSTESPLTLNMNATYAFTPAYLSTLVEPGIVYVSTAGLDASNANGSKGLPFNDIQNAIDSLATGEVRIAAGTFVIEAPIEMKQGVSLVGSYSVENHGANWSKPVFGSPTRGLGLEPSTIINLNIIGAGTSDNYLAVAKFSGGEFTNSTSVKGINFSYDSLSRSYVAGLLFENDASPTIAHCRIVSGEATQSSQGIRSIASSPKIQNSYVKAGEASSSIGIFNTGAIEVLSSEVHTSLGGSNTVGIFNNLASGAIVNNSSISSHGLNSSGFFGYSYGLYNISSATTITNNNIMAKGGGPTSSFGATLGTRALYESGSTSTITGNTITASESAFAGNGVAYYASSSPSLLINNQILIASGSSVAYGLYLVNSNIIIGGNSINTGRVTSSGGPVYGIYSSNSNPLILNNTIIGGDSGDTGESSYGIYMGSGSAIISNNIIFSKASRSPRYGIYSSTGAIKPKIVSHNAFFDLSTAWYAPQGTTGVYFVTQTSDFTTARTGIDESKMIGNIGEAVGADEPLWSTNSIFNGYASGDYTLNSSASNSLKTAGLDLTSSLIQSFIDQLGVVYSATSTAIFNLLLSDSSQKDRLSDNWSIGALQY